MIRSFVQAGLLLTAVLSTGCAYDAPRVQQFRGPQPASVLVLPAVAPTDPRVDLNPLDEALVSVLRRRGYTVTLDDPANGWLAGRGWDPADDQPPPSLADLLADGGFDAVWISRVRQWSFVAKEGYPLEFALECEVVATRDGQQLWSRSFEGWQPTATQVRARDPFAEIDPFEADDPIGWHQVETVLEDDEIASMVASHVCRHLPPRRN